MSLVDSFQGSLEVLMEGQVERDESPNKRKKRAGAILKTKIRSDQQE